RPPRPRSRVPSVEDNPMVGSEASPSQDTVFAHARAYVQAGLSLLPVSRDGSKGPALGEWAWLQEQLPTADLLAEWDDVAGPKGIGVSGGGVSGNLETIDFDADADVIFPLWRELVEGEQPGLYDRLCVVRTPRSGGGYHVRYRCQADIPRSTKLARNPDDVTL